MATQEDLTLENALNEATNPVNKEEDWDAIARFTDQVNNELEGPQYAVRLLAHKIQSPIEREALHALSTVESCVKNCGRRFHQEIGKFRFLNEMIKVISPKYLGSKTSEKVKKKCIELMYCWHKGLPHEPKCTDAYIMLKQQGIVKDDPKYMDMVSMELPKPVPEEERRATFEDAEKSKLLAQLLKSKNPEDLQAANRLIKNMVKQDTERMEKVSRRINDLETIHTNVKLLSEMVSIYNPSSTTQAEREMMKELFDSLEKLRPKLFRLSSETDENDIDGLNTILQAYDEVSAVMNTYKKTVEGVTENGRTDTQREELLKVSGTGSGTSLLDIEFDQPPAYSLTSQPPCNFNPFKQDDEMLSLGLHTGNLQSSRHQSGGDSLLSDLDDIFTPSPHTKTAVYPEDPLSTMVNHNSSTGPATCTSPASFPGGLPVSFTSAQSSGANPTPASHMQTLQPAVSAFGNISPLPEGATSPAMGDLDLLGQSLMQQNLSENKANYSFEKRTKTNVKIPMNQMDVSQANKSTISISMKSLPAEPLVAMADHPPGVAMVTGSSSTTTTPTVMPGSFMAGHPAVGTSQQQSAVVKPLTDVFVPLETIQPGSAPPVNAYDKNCVKVMLHVAQDRPREDVTVMVVSVISTNTAPLHSFTFQAAVPKVMKIKLQPPSATDLPAFNPILPPSVITQVLLLANPHKEKIRLKYKISYILNDQTHTDVGDIDGFTVQ